MVISPSDVTISEVELETILPLRTLVLRPGNPPTEPAEFAGDREERTHHFAALHRDEVLAVASFYEESMPDDDAPAVRLRGMAVHPNHRRRGLGAHLLTTTLIRLPLLYPTSRWLWCNARLGAVTFYEEQGFETFSPTFSIPGIGPHQRMKRKLPVALA